jgi:hypothetical protein
MLVGRWSRQYVGPRLQVLDGAGTIVGNVVALTTYEGSRENAETPANGIDRIARCDGVEAVLKVVLSVRWI